MVLSSAPVVAGFLEFSHRSPLIRDGSWAARTGETYTVDLGAVKSSDRVYIVMNSSTVEVDPSYQMKSLPFDVEGRPFDYSTPSLDPSRMLYIAPGENQDVKLVLNATSEATPYIQRSVGVIQSRMTQVLSGIEYQVNATREDNPNLRFPLLLLILPFNNFVQQDFQVTGTLGLVSGRVGSVNLGIVDESQRTTFGYILLPFTAQPGASTQFTVNNTTPESYGKTTSLNGDYVSYLYFAIILDMKVPGNPVTAKVSVGTMMVQNRGSSTLLPAVLQDSFKVHYSIYVFPKFIPSLLFQVSLVALTSSLSTLVIFRLRKRWGFL